MASDLRTIVGWIGKYTRQLIETKADADNVYTKGEIDEKETAINGNITQLSDEKVDKNGTEQIVVSKAGDKQIVVKNTDNNGISLEYESEGTRRRGIYDYDLSKWLIGVNGAGEMFADGHNKLETVVASGDNYIRYANGIQICWLTKTFSVAIQTAWGNVYDTSYILDITRFTFPVSFLAGQYVVQASISNRSAFIERLAIGEGGSCGVTYLMSPTSQVSASYTIQYLVVGRWK